LEKNEFGYVYKKELIDKFINFHNKIIDINYLKREFKKENIIYDYKKRETRNKINFKGAFQGYSFKLENNKQDID